MLDNMRRQGASIFIYLIFGILIAIFVININPGGRGGRSGGCGTSSNVIIDVGGSRANVTSFQIAAEGEVNRVARGGQNNARLKEFMALETLVRREILASAASDRGIRVTTDQALDAIKHGEYFTHAPLTAQGRMYLQQVVGGYQLQGGMGLGSRISSSGRVSEMFLDPPNNPDVDPKPTWNKGKFDSWVSQFGNISRNAYIEEQARSMQATLMAEVLIDSVRVSREEAHQEFLFRNNTVDYDVVTFSPVQYKPYMKLTEEDVNRYAKLHADEVQKKFDAEKATYKDTKPALRLRQVLIAQTEADKAAGEKAPDATTPTTPPDGTPPTTPAPGATTPPAAGSGSGSAAPAPAATGSAAAPAAAGSGSAAPAPADKKDDKKDDKKVADKKDDKKVADKKDEKKDDKAAGGEKKDEKKVDPKFGRPHDEALALLRAAKKDIESGKKKWAEVVKELNTEEIPKWNAGDLGWKKIDAPSLGDQALNDAIKTLKPGEVTEPIFVQGKGVYMFLADGKRQGDLELKDVQYEIAEGLAKDEWSKEQAKRAALGALEKLRDPTGKGPDQRLDTMFKEGPKDTPIPEMGALSPQEQAIRLSEMIRTNGPFATPVVIEGKDQPAASKADSGGPTGSAAPAPAGSATPAGSAAPAAGAGSGSATKAATPVVLPKKKNPSPADNPAPVATTDELPKFTDDYTGVLTHQKKVARCAMRRTATGVECVPDVPELGNMSDVLFDQLGEGRLSARVYEIGGKFVIFQVMKKGHAEEDAFAKEADAITEQLRSLRAETVIDDFVRSRCEELRKDNKIKAYRDETPDKDGKVAKYDACFSFRRQAPGTVPMPVGDAEE